MRNCGKNVYTLVKVESKFKRTHQGDTNVLAKMWSELGCKVRYLLKVLVLRKKTQRSKN